MTLTDVTSSYAVLSLQGPNSRDIFAKVTNAALDNDTFPFATSQEIDLGYARVIANRLTYVGELRWELDIPTEFAQGVFGAVMEAGAGHGLKSTGNHVLEHLRSERAYREYELDLTPEDTPLEAGLGFTVKLDKPGGFIGRDVLLRQKEAGSLTKRFVMFKLSDSELLLFHQKLIRRDGEIVGYISSGAYGFTLGASVGMGYINCSDGVSKDFVASGKWEIEIACERYPADASLRVFFDPTGKRVKV